MTPRVVAARALSLSALSLLVGCDDPAPRHTTHPIEMTQEVVTRETILDATTAKRLGYGPREESDAGLDPAKLRKVLKFDRPENWQEIAPSEFRHLNFAITSTSGAAVECYLTLLPGGGTGARPNVDRWRGQFSLPKLTDEEFAALPAATLFGRPAVRVDLAGEMMEMRGGKKPDSAMTAMFSEFPNFDVTLKLVGPRVGVGEESAHFDAFARSLAFDFDAVAGASDDPTPPSAATPTASSGATAKVPGGMFDPQAAKWVVPAGWTVGSGSSMRLVTLDIPGGAQCWITPLPGESGGLASNLNRWRKEMGQSALTDSEIAALPKLNVLGVDAPWLDLSGKYQGMGGPKDLGDARMFALGCARPDVFLSVKMVGPPAVLEAEKANFIAFCQSIEGGS